MTKGFYTLLSLFAATVALSSCGVGGGGGGDSLDSDEEALLPAQVVVSAEPREIDPGDRIRIRAKLSEISPTGVFLKIRFPINLTYIAGTSELTVEDDKVTLKPVFNTATATDNYIVYDLPTSAFGSQTSAEIRLTLEGVEPSAERIIIEADSDFNDPKKSAAQKFSTSEPRFDPSSDTTIIISGETATTPTPTPTAAAAA